MQGIPNLGYDCGAMASTSGEGGLSHSSHSMLSIVEECELESLTAPSESPSVPLSPLLASRHTITSQFDDEIEEDEEDSTAAVKGISLLDESTYL